MRTPLSKLFVGWNCDFAVRHIPAVALTAIALILVLGFSETARAERWYGNFVLSTEKTSTTPVGMSDGSTHQVHVFVNVEDALFYKNKLRLAGNLDWRREASGRKEYRPVYYADLSGYRYTLNTSYSSYKREYETLLGSPVDVYTHDLRSILAVTVPKYPSLSIMYSRIKSFDEMAVTAANNLQRTTVIESGYSRNQYSVKGNYYRTRNEDIRRANRADVVEAASGTFTGTAPASRIGTASVTLNYYDTRRSVADTSVSQGHTSSVAATASSSYIKHLNATLSYSGQFAGSSVRATSSPDTRSEMISGSVGYSPTSYLDFQSIKSYQIIGGNGQYDILEFISLAAGFSRYLRQGLETRMGFTRTFYQKSNRTEEFRDSLGTLDSARHIDHYSLDTWYGSLGFNPMPYVKSSASVTLSRDSHPIQLDRRYQMSWSLESRMALRRNLDGHASYTGGYLGRTLQLGRAYSESYNLGFGWLPRANITFNLSYIHSIFNTTVQNRSSALSLNATYTFRRVYSLTVTYNLRDRSEGTTGTQSGASDRPNTLNAQLTIFLSPRSTLTLGHFRDRGPLSDLGRRTTSTWQGRLNIQL